ncbi:hypothetical protein E2C01_067714 [Portunus trituberculatus]|uniref:Uncharacterized protein n=1 Tax=Portunus trituberculatus TaxID=210409 RepID=A0A5B7HVU0_PORTR|nr:hypothetical protein [Portunus trituberculatus]
MFYLTPARKNPALTTLPPPTTSMPLTLTTPASPITSLFSLALKNPLRTLVLWKPVSQSASQRSNYPASQPTSHSHRFTTLRFPRVNEKVRNFVANTVDCYLLFPQPVLFPHESEGNVAWLQH